MDMSHKTTCYPYTYKWCKLLPLMQFLVNKSVQDLFQFSGMALHKGCYIPSQCTDGQCLMLSGSHMANIIIIKPIRSL